MNRLVPQGLIAQGINFDCFNYDDRTDSLSPHYPLLDAKCAVNRVPQNIEFLPILLTVALHWVIYHLVFEISRVRICTRRAAVQGEISLSCDIRRIRNRPRPFSFKSFQVRHSQPVYLSTQYLSVCLCVSA
jgi:hypothetical protein